MAYDDDTETVDRCRSGDEGAFEVLVRRYQRPIHHVLLRMVRDPDDARDLAQVTFLKAFQHLATFDRSQRFYSWLYRIAIHEALNHQRRGRHSSPLPDDTPGGGLDPERLAADAQLGQLLQEALMSLDPNDRAVLVMRHFAELSYQEIAVVLGVPEKTVKSRLFSGRQRLRARLERKGVVR